MPRASHAACTRTGERLSSPRGGGSGPGTGGTGTGGTGTGVPEGAGAARGPRPGAARGAGGSAIARPANSPENDALPAGVDPVRADFGTHLRSGRVDFSAPEDGSAGPPGLLADFARRPGPAGLIRFRRQLAAIMDELQASPEVDGEVPGGAEGAVEAIVPTLLYGVRPERPSRAGSLPATES